ncbi:MAG: S1 RNA-binding domain-containing protein, partial [Firmicutes bacterium]|nr:S1 RNA-binding domain-containing protein [Bacillota bacterium]
LAVKVEEASAQSSVTERQAQEMEREADKMKMTEYMAGHIGEYFDGIISSVTNFGFFVQLENTVEGLVRAADLQDDYYQFQPEQYRLVGERYHKIYGLGDRVTIQVTRASVASREIDFALVDPDGGERQYSHRDRRGGERKGGKHHENKKIRGRKFRK